MTQTVRKEVFGLSFEVVEPASIGFPQHTTQTFDDHEPVIERWCRGIKPGQLVVDAGACFGSYTLTALAAGAFVVAYEPFDDGFAILTANVWANGWQDRCLIRKEGLWKHGEPYPLELARQVFGHHYPAKDLAMVALDDEVTSLGLRSVDWIKIDTEGTELGILEGAAGCLKTFRPTLIIEDHESVSTDANDEVSRYPERIQSGRRMRELLESLDYAIDVVPWDVSRHYWVCAPR